MISNIHTALSLDSKKSSKVIPIDELNEISDEEKRECVLQSPKFGMCGLMKYMMEREGGRECSHVFGRQFLLPIFVFIAQWLLFASIVLYNLKSPFQCKQSAIEHKLLMGSISMIYFVHSFFVYDQIRDRSKQTKTPCSSSVVVMLDTFQEHSFTLFVHIANLWIVFLSEDLLDALFNSLALEFLMNLDNEYERLYFKYSIEEAVFVYDNVFVSRDESYRAVEKRKASDTVFRYFRALTFVPYKILSCGFIMLPIYCAAMMVFGVMCK